MILKIYMENFNGFVNFNSFRETIPNIGGFKNTITTECFLVLLPITPMFFSMVFGSLNHWLQQSSIVWDHWSNDGLVSMHHSGLHSYNKIVVSRVFHYPKAFTEVDIMT